MIKYLIPASLDTFKKDCPDRAHWEAISTVLRNALDALISGETFLVKKRFGQKIVYTCNADYGRHPHRLLFERVDSPTRYVLRSVVWNHDYRKALTLEPLTIEEMQETVVSAEYNEGEATPLISYNNSGYELTQIQSEILKCSTFPQLIVGPPGSGKTLTAMAFFQELTLNRVQEDSEEPLRLLYLTGSKELKNAVLRSWQDWIKETFDDTVQRPVEVVFSTFEEQLVNPLPREDAIERIRRLLKISSPENSALTAEAVFDEFLINSHVLIGDIFGSSRKEFNQSNYKQRGVNKSSLDLKDLNKLYDLFASFYTQMQDKGECILGISVRAAGDATTQFDFTVVDEAQNNTLTDLLNALHQTKNKQILFLGDSLQKGTIKVSSLPLLEPDLHAQNIALKTHQLPGTHRLKPGVAAVANDLVRLYTYFKGGLADSTSYSSLSSNAVAADDDNSLSWVSEWSDKYHSLGKNAYAAALIFNERDRKAAKHLINSDNVFTIEEAQGLEFTELFIYVSAKTMESFLPISKTMKERDINKDTLLAEKKSLSSQKGIVDGAHLEFLSLFYVALTRTCGDAWVYIEPLNNSDNHQHDLFLTWLKSRFTQEEAKALTEQVSSSEEWLTMAHRLIDQNQVTQAKENLIRHCGFNVQAAEEYINQRLQSLRELSARNSVASSLASSALAAPKTAAKLTSGKKVKKEPMLTSLKPDEAKWLEGNLKNLKQPEKIKSLFGWSQALVTAMLFHHKMLNGNCLFVNLVCNNKKNAKKILRIIFDKLGLKLAGAHVLRSLTESPQGILWLDEDSTLLKPYIKDFEWFASLGGVSLFYSLCTTDVGIAFLSSYWEDIREYLTVEGLFTPITGDGPRKGTTPFYELCIRPEGVVLLRSYWKDIRVHLTAEGLFAPVTADGVNKGATPFYGLCTSSEGIVLLRSYWNDIRLHLTAAGLFAPITGDGLYNGTTPFYVLCTRSEGIDFLSSYWKDIREHLTAEGLFSPVTADGPDKGITPFYELCSSSEGVVLLRSYWKDIREHLTAEGLFAPVIADGPDKGTTPFYVLCSYPEDIVFLSSYWKDIRPHLTAAGLFAPITGDGPDKGRTPFYLLCSCPEGIAFLSSYWEDIREYLTVEGLFTPITGDGPRKGTTPFYELCIRPEGVVLLRSYWKDIREHLTAEGLFAPVTADRPNKGTTPFYGLCSSSEGVVLLSSYWKDIREHLTVEGLFSPVTADGLYKGRTPFYMLCSCSEGVVLLKSYWNDIRPHLTVAGLFAPITGDGPDKGMTPFYMLCSCSEGVVLLRSYWNDIRPHLTAAGLFAPITGDGPDKGMTPFYLLCSYPEGIALLKSYWKDIREHLTADGLFAPVTADEPNKGVTPFYGLCSSPEGIALLKSYWKDIREHLTAEGLFAPVTADGPDKGTTPFYQLCSCPEGVVLLRSYWKDIREHLTAEGLFSPVTADGPDKGTTPFYVLCSYPEGIAFLSSYWKDIREHLTAEGLFAPVTADGSDKGTTPFYGLCTRSEGIVLLRSYWNDIREHLTVEGLFAPITGDGPYKGVTPFYVLCTRSESIAFLSSYWNDIRVHLIAERLFSPVTGDGSHKGSTPFCKLCSSEAGIALLKAHWKSTFSQWIKESDIANVPNREKLRELFKLSSLSSIGYFSSRTSECAESAAAPSAFTPP